MYHPFVAGEKVYLRRLERGDLEGDYFNWLNDYEITRWTETGVFPNSMEAMERWFETMDSSPNEIVFAVCDKKTDKHIGNIRIHIDWVNRVAETGRIMGDKEFRGKGYAEESFKLAVDYCFKRLNLNRVAGGTIEGNIPALKTWEKLGYTIEGRLRKASFKDGEYHDIIRGGILREEWKF